MQFGGEAWNRFIADKHKEGISDKSENEIAGYLDFRQAIGSYLTMDAGLRIDHHTVTGTEWIPQVGLSVQLPQNASLKAMASKGFRNPTFVNCILRSQPFLHQRGQYDSDHSHRRTPTERKHRQSRELGSRSRHSISHSPHVETDS